MIYYNCKLLLLLIVCAFVLICLFNVLFILFYGACFIVCARLAFIYKLLNNGLFRQSYQTGVICRHC
jgi:hypothetical protein